MIVEPFTDVQHDDGPLLAQVRQYAPHEIAIEGRVGKRTTEIELHRDKFIRKCSQYGLILRRNERPVSRECRNAFHDRLFLPVRNEEPIHEQRMQHVRSRQCRLDNGIFEQSAIEG